MPEASRHQGGAPCHSQPGGGAGRSTTRRLAPHRPSTTISTSAERTRGSQGPPTLATSPEPTCAGQVVPLPALSRDVN